MLNGFYFYTIFLYFGERFNVVFSIGMNITLRQKIEIFYMCLMNVKQYMEEKKP